MEKVKVTQEQAKAIEYALQEVGEYKGNPDKLLRHASMSNVNFRNELHPLDTIDIVTLAKALYIGYEVEPEFKVGDWVVDTLNNYTFRIHAVVNHRVVPDWFEGTYDKGSTDESDWIPIGYLRHATPEEIAKEKERRWWAKHGRDVWELLEGDLITNKLIGEIKEIEFCQNGTDSFGLGGWKVVCFAEDRRDE